MAQPEVDLVRDCIGCQSSHYLLTMMDARSVRGQPCVVMTLTPSPGLGLGLVRWVLQSVGPAGTIRSFFSKLQLNGCVCREKVKENTPCPLSLPQTESWVLILLLGLWLSLQRTRIKFLNKLQTSLGIYALAGREVHLGSGSALTG